MYALNLKFLKKIRFCAVSFLCYFGVIYGEKIRVLENYVKYEQMFDFCNHS